MKRIIYSLLSDMMSRNLTNAKTSISPSEKFPYKVEVIAENLNIPWAIDISDEGKLYFTERIGSIRVIENGNLNFNPVITLKEPFISRGEGGLMGVVLDPSYLQNHYIYVMYSYLEDNKVYNKVVRLIENNNKAFIDKVILDKIPGGRIHNGGRLKIGPDKKLYITTGDAGIPNLAQDLTSLAGKILRVELDGSIPKDNPIINSSIYSLGHRNPQGLAWNSNNILYEAEHGQAAHDEINIIKAGINYGWPIVQGNEVSNNILSQKPLIQSGEETWAPSGITFISQGPWKSRLLVANLRGSQLLSISLNEEGTMVTNVESIMKNEFGRLREVVEAKDGSIYITTNNRDGRGNPNINDDKIIKLTLN
ncbi:PQQ-dependent sugar dehydrogenase [Clostridium sp. C8]|jgi:glucose/arabinose dehydrogenase|uniref:PQQ-dependent sugar dehydrogenase n=1 Tax=Clostridium sp. C8 TaxID=1667357 RepID=UPI00062E794F|nr:PQQ-dependent sugar dehydrogenase [Clostridium sp. C8]KLE16168.1 glucose sorbosone dehydrogenase [Clostridium sp. C8]